MRMVRMLLVFMLGAASNTHADTSPAATTAPAAELASFKQEIRQLYNVKEKAWAAGDAETIVTKFYAADAVSAGEGDPTTVGRADLRKAYQQFVKDVTSVRIESVRSVVNGNAGWDWANFYHTPKPEKAKDYPPSPIRILFLWSKEHGQWICKGEMFVNGKFPIPLQSSNGKP
jgi:uncharacterized protein (TIGR02246 family)